MKSKVAVRLGGPYNASYYRSGSVSEQHARKWFFLAVREVAPEVFEYIRDQVYPEYQKTNAHEYSFGWEKLPEYIELLPEQFGHLRTLESNLKGWGKHFRFNENWAFDFALATMNYWNLETNVADASHLDPAPIVLAIGGLRSYSEENKLFELWTKYQQEEHERVGLGIRSHLEHYDDWETRIIQVMKSFRFIGERYLKERDLEETPMKESFEHFQWTALRQIHSYSPELIAEALDVGKTSVRDGIKSVLELMSWKLRKIPRGRRKNYEGKSYRDQAVEQIKKRMKDSEKYAGRRHLL